MKIITHNTDSTIRDIYPLASLTIGILLITSLARVGYLGWENNLQPTRDPIGQAAAMLFGGTFMAFIVIGSNWKKLWSFILSAKADRLARRYDYFEITGDEWVTLSSPEWSGEIIDFMGLNRSFVHFDNEQDRILFRLGR